MAARDISGERRADGAGPEALPKDPDPIDLIDIAEIPGGGQLRLLRCGDDYSIQFGDDELMGSRDYLSEQALATRACARLARNDGRVLVGGLGMGFTLGAALAAWAPSASIVVAELVPQVVKWASGPLAHLFGKSLTDPRVSVQITDVHDLIARERDHFDAILLDVDNGPDGFMKPDNDRLYCNWGLRSAYAALRSGGVLAVWSSYPDLRFGQGLGAAGFHVDEIRMPAYAGANDDWHHIWFASKPA